MGNNTYVGENMAKSSKISCVFRKFDSLVLFATSKEKIVPRVVKFRSITRIIN